MQIPDYFLTRPATDDDYTADFERLYTEMLGQGEGAEIQYTLSAPKWQFLCYLCDSKQVLLHGSGNPDISEFEPRQSNDVEEFGNRKAVYAASDGLWAMYFAIVNRERVTSLLNGCFRVPTRENGTRENYYYFSINDDALAEDMAWRDGMMYILPREPFEQQPAFISRGVEVEVQQWASPVSVKPIAKLAVTPQDFPFLQEVNGHNVERVMQRVTENPGGFPWRE